jgi:hypothetical protein
VVFRAQSIGGTNVSNVCWWRWWKKEKHPSIGISFARNNSVAILKRWDKIMIAPENCVEEYYLDK